MQRCHRCRAEGCYYLKLGGYDEQKEGYYKLGGRQVGSSGKKPTSGRAAPSVQQQWAPPMQQRTGPPFPQQQRAPPMQQPRFAPPMQQQRAPPTQQPKIRPEGQKGSGLIGFVDKAFDEPKAKKRIRNPEDILESSSEGEDMSQSEGEESEEESEGSYDFGSQGSEEYYSELEDRTEVEETEPEEVSEE